MNLPLDTHALIWVFDGSPTISAQAGELIADGRNKVFVSAVTAQEIAVKRSLGKLELRGDYRDGLTRYRSTPLSVSTEHALAVETLPPHHADPFDRLLIAQARLEDLTPVTRDERSGDYGVRTVRA